MPGTVARSDPRPPGMRTVAGSILGSGNILSWRLVMKSFLRPFSPYRWFKYGSCQLVLVNCFGSLPRNSVVRLTYRLDMTIVVDWDVKPQIKQTSLFSDIVPEVTQPSLGVGYEIGRAVAMGKKILCLYRQQPDKSKDCQLICLLLRGCRSRGCEFEPQSGHITFMEIGHKIISMAVLPLSLIQERQLSVTGERMAI